MQINLLIGFYCRNYRQHYPYGDNMSSDTSSAYSGSDTMHSLQSAQEELDLSGECQSSHTACQSQILKWFTVPSLVQTCLTIKSLLSKFVLKRM